MLELIFNLPNLLILTILVFLNYLLLRSSKRKRRLGFMPLRITGVVITAYLSIAAYIHFSDNQALNSAPKAEKVQVSYHKLQKRTRWSRLFHLDNRVIDNRPKVLFMQYSLRISLIQSLIAFFLAFYGLISVNNRNGFYYQMLVLNFISILICCISEANMN